MVMQNALEREFHNAMVNIYRQALADCQYKATYFLQMVTARGGVGTARYLLSTDDPQSGFTELYLCGRLDLTVEAHVIKPEFRGLFTDSELRQARKRLNDLGFGSSPDASAR